MTLFVLAHGGWHGGWCWSALADELAARGHSSVAPDLPATDPAAGAVDYAAVLTGALGGAADAVLVAHSLAGLCAPLVPVRRVVYLAAMLPVPGRSVDERARAGERMTRRGIGRGQTVNPDGSTQWDPAAAVEMLYPDSRPEVARAAAARLRPQHWTITSEVSPVTSLPADATYVRCSDDKIIDADWVRSAVPDPVEIPGDHSPFLARPAALAELLTGLASGPPAGPSSGSPAAPSSGSPAGPAG
ncbi:MAG TPA: alpha/beta fold hydrolase [Mycobacteriales bacterium]|nr:alpha/beta fold hydrolase [Mycobacteriales bacterium]